MGKYKELLETAESFEDHFMKPTGSKSTGIPKNVPKVKVKVADDKFKTEQVEREVRKACNDWLKKNGWIVNTIYTGGIPLPGGRMAPNPCVGIPDTLCFHIQTKTKMWIEYKRNKGGSLSIDQINFHKLLTMTGDKVLVVTSLPTLKELLNGKE